jgi:amidase
MSNDLNKMDGLAQAELVASGEASASELVEAAIERIESVNGELNAVITKLYDQARRRAQSDELSDGPFKGVPFLLKDLDAASAGDPFHCGMKLLKELDYRPDHDSTLVKKFNAAGFVTLGKTNTPELGLTVTTEPESYGPSLNPWNTAHSTGGSSGGSGAAVASGMVPVAHASDGGGSIRIPASECGLVGLKPTRGRCSLGPDYGEYWAGLVNSHVVTRSVRDSAAVLDCVASYEAGDPYTAPGPSGSWLQAATTEPGRLKLGLMTSFPGQSIPLNPECETAVLNTGRLLSSLGHEVEESHPSAFDELEELRFHFMRVIGSWVAASLNEWATITGRSVGDEQVEAGTAMMASIGRPILAADYIDTLKWMSRYTRRMLGWWQDDGFDLLVTPTLGSTPPRIGDLSPKDGDVESSTQKILELIPYTPVANVTGQPAISLPLHWSNDGLPVGVMITAAHGREDLLYSVAGQLEKANPWADRRPPVFAS